MDRRNFLRTGACVTAGLVANVCPTFAADASIEIDLPETSPEISRHIYGQFIEHLGGVIYDGIWVGPESKIQNVGGIRKRFVDDMKRIGVPNFRWPGGCFADGYHWRDGIGDRTKRPRTYNYWQRQMPAGADATETNQFGIHEFIRLCRLTGAEPYLAANMASGSPEEFHNWVLYCNAPAATVAFAKERVANGDEKPFGVRWWGVGNESWGCGGDMSPQEYAMLYRRFVTQFPAYEPKPFLVAVGPRGHSKDLDLGWTSGFFAAMGDGHRSRVDGLSVHYYSDYRDTPERVSSFEPGGWYDVVHKGFGTEQVIEQHWAVMGKYDREHRTKFVIDEWGVWYKPGEEITPAYLLSQPLTLRDALHTAVTFDVFNRHADKIAMTNIAQTINCIHSLFLAQGDRYTRTPPYYVFEMYRNHMGARLAPMRVNVAELSVPSREGSIKMPGLSGSASVKGKVMSVTLTNPSLESALAVNIGLSTSNITEARGTVLNHAEMTARNTFEDPENVKPKVHPVSMRGKSVQVAIPAHAVVLLELQTV